MKKTLRTTISLGALAGLLAVSNSFAGGAEPGFVDFGKFTPAKDAEFVEVNIPSNLITMALDLAKKAEPEVSEALKALKGVRVNVIGLTDENRDDVEKRVGDIRSQLESKGWDKLVTAIQKNEDVRVYAKMRNTEAFEGILVTVLDHHKQAVLINVVGDVRPEKLAMLGEKLDIEPLKKLKIDSQAK